MNLMRSWTKTNTSLWNCVDLHLRLNHTDSTVEFVLGERSRLHFLSVEFSWFVPGVVWIWNFSHKVAGCLVLGCNKSNDEVILSLPYFYYQLWMYGSRASNRYFEQPSQFVKPTTNFPTRHIPNWWHTGRQAACLESYRTQKTHLTYKNDAYSNIGWKCIYFIRDDIKNFDDILFTFHKNDCVFNCGQSCSELFVTSLSTTDSLVPIGRRRPFVYQTRRRLHQGRPVQYRRQEFLKHGRIVILIDSVPQHSAFGLDLLHHTIISVQPGEILHTVGGWEIERVQLEVDEMEVNAVMVDALHADWFGQSCDIRLKIIMNSNSVCFFRYHHR